MRKLVQRFASVSCGALVAMAAIQYHRGPDGFGWQAMEGVGLSHARLSIIDLDEDRGRQPFVSEDRRLMLNHLTFCMSYYSTAVAEAATNVLNYEAALQALIDDDPEVALYMAREVVEEWERAGRQMTFPEARYPRTAARLALMMDRLLADGFASYWD